MKTPEEKYMEDPNYKRIVDMMETLLDNKSLTSTELREACTYACIRYETRIIGTGKKIPKKVKEALEELAKFSKVIITPGNIPDICTSNLCDQMGCDHCKKCSHAFYIGSTDVDDRKWEWQHNPQLGPRFNFDLEEGHPAWKTFNSWIKRKGL